MSKLKSGLVTVSPDEGMCGCEAVGIGCGQVVQSDKVLVCITSELSDCFCAGLNVDLTGRPTMVSAAMDRHGP